MSNVNCGSSNLRIQPLWIREFLAEFIGSFILVLFGNGSVAQSVLSKGAAGQFLSVNLAYGFGLTMAIYAAGGVSGAHLNPAVTVAMAVLRKCQWRKVPYFILAQYLGTFLSSAVLFGVYHDAINHFDGGVRSIEGPQATAGIFSTYPQPFVSTYTAFADQIVGTAVLMICVLAITDERNMAVPKGLVPIAIGLTVFAIGAGFGFNCGYAINPARDLGPRIFTAMSGWGIEVFRFRNYNYFWVPIVGPHLGAILGAVVYHTLISMHWPPAEQEKEELRENPDEKQMMGPKHEMGVTNTLFDSRSGSDLQLHPASIIIEADNTKF